ncbi:MAG: tetratricopeptide repeat-containing glycosyltransferase family protein [Alphaproteobacteria bacterium]
MKTKNKPFAMMQKAVSFHKQGHMEDAEQSYQQVLKDDPKHIDALRLLGALYVQWKKMDSAIEYFEKALHVKPDHTEVRNNLGIALFSQGNALRKAGQSIEASQLYERLVKLHPNDVNLRNNLGTIFHDMAKFDEAMEQYEIALQIEPNSADALVNRAGLLVELNRPDEACRGYEQALKINPNSADAKWGKSLAMLMLGDYENGWKLYEARFERNPITHPLLTQNKRWDGCPLEGKRLLIWGEQGFGDVLQFIRYAALCKEKGGFIIVQCRAPLVRLLQNCPYIDEVVTEATLFDYHIPIMSLPFLFGTTLNTIPSTTPYLTVSDEARLKWASRFAGSVGLKVGLVWAGNPRKNLIEAHATDRQRSINLSMMKPLLDLPSCQFYNLQKDEASAEIMRNGLQSRLINYMPGVEDFMDTAAIIENLDLVISVDTSVVHLAGGLGKEVWVLSRFGGCWRWLRNQETNPWYPTVRIFSQPSPGDWDGCLQTVKKALMDKIK